MIELFLSSQCPDGRLEVALLLLVLMNVSSEGIGFLALHVGRVGAREQPTSSWKTQVLSATGHGVNLSSQYSLKRSVI